MLELSVLAFAAIAAWLVHVRRPVSNWVGVVAMAALGFVLAAALTALFGVPRPQIHDEWSYLFAADTFASGRLSNPTPPSWPAFESFHVLVRPTYTSKYPPAQGVVLALGQLLTGLPIVGAWLSMALLGAALCWCTAAAVGGSWAAIVTALYLVRLASTSYSGIGYWAHSYWGGALAATGGALVLGSVLRLDAEPTTRDSILLGLGVGLLANTRPFEGLFMAAPLVIVLLAGAWRRRETPGRARQALLPAGAVLVVVAAMMSYYNARVTGDPLRLPYTEHEMQYAAAPPVMFLQRKYPDYHATALAEFYEGEYIQWQRNKTVPGFVDLMREKARTAWSFYAGMLWTVVLSALLCLFRDRHVKLAALGVGSTLVAYASVNPTQPHYLAPLTAPVLVLLAVCARYWAQRFGADRVVAVLATVTGVSATSALVEARSSPTIVTSLEKDRARIESELGAKGGKHLVLVRYAPRHPVNLEWIYNRANLRTAPIVWAREDNLALSRNLVREFPDRTIWRFDEELGKLAPGDLPPPLE